MTAAGATRSRRESSAHSERSSEQKTSPPADSR